MNKTLRVVLGLLVSAFCLWFVFRKFDFNFLWAALAGASFVWLVPATIMFCLNMLMRSFRWKILLSPLKEIPIRSVFPNLMLGFFMNNILPARGGEVVRTVSLSRIAGIPLPSVLGTVVAERLTDMVGLFCVIMLASKLLPWDKLPVLPIAGVLVAGIIGVIVVVQISKKSSNQGLIYKLTSGFMALNSPAKIFGVLGLSLLIWCGELIIVLLVSRTLALNLGFFESAALLTGLSVGVMIPAAPGYVGTYEFFGKTALVLLGKPEDLSLSYVFLLHFFQLVLVALAALPIMVFPKILKNET